MDDRKPCQGLLVSAPDCHQPRQEGRTDREELGFPVGALKAILCVHGGPDDFCPLLQKTELSRLETDEV